MSNVTESLNECCCMDGAYSHCDICSPPFPEGWLERNMREVRNEVKSWPQWMKDAMGVKL